MIRASTLRKLIYENDTKLIYENDTKLIYENETKLIYSKQKFYQTEIIQN